MASTQTIHLPVYDTERIKEELAKKSKDQKSFIGKLLSYLAKGLDEPTTTTKTLTDICESNLTAKDVLSLHATVEDDDLRKKLDMSIAPYITDYNDDQFALAFDGIDENTIKNLGNEKGEISLQEDTIQGEASAINVKVYYARYLLVRENGKYHLNLAYYHFNSSLPPDSIRAQLRSENEINSDLLLAKLTAFNTLHRLLHQNWSDRIQLYLVSTLPDQ